ncbi:hypothetical protein WPG_3006 [Winogradskyella sp. PG-2]|nr:hypothetical protein WPG_3006 [Winogradskyella sp. PG-2]
MYGPIGAGAFEVLIIFFTCAEFISVSHPATAEILIRL